MNAGNALRGVLSGGLEGTLGTDNVGLEIHPRVRVWTGRCHLPCLIKYAWCSDALTMLVISFRSVAGEIVKDG